MAFQVSFHLNLEQEISNYGGTKGNEDFWTLDEAGLIEPQLSLIRAKSPNMNSLKMIQAAHQEARKLVNSITEKIKKDESARVSGTIQDKKTASIDKGGKTKVISAPSFKGKSITDVGKSLIQQK